jgi:hypothetical protein
LIEFDKYGNLLPYDIVETDLFTFERHFVAGMRNKEHRHLLFTSYLKYVKQLNEIISNDYYQWINGSFVTRAFKPNDVDLVSFIDFRTVEKHQSGLKSFAYPISKAVYDVDAYIVKTYSADHKNAKFAKSDNLYWMHQFLKTKPDRQGRQMNKGFIKINMSHEKI